MSREAHAFRVRVPASTSNLGSGFDTVAAALSLFLEVQVEPSPCGGWSWDEATQLAFPAGQNRVEQALRATFEHLGKPRQGAHLRMDTAIPVARGLGSSAAATLAGIHIGARLGGTLLSPPEIFNLALPLEGHPDNLAAAQLGGWTLARRQGTGMRAERIRTALECRFVVAVPEARVSTDRARRALPSYYSRQDVVYNLERCALLVHALEAGRPELLREATGDRLHQRRRASLVAGLESLLALEELPRELEPEVLALFLSGSGSSVVALVRGEAASVGRWMIQRLERAGTRARWLELELARQGAQIIEGASASVQ